MAVSAKQRQQEKRERDKLSAEEREARLLSRQIVTKLYHGEDAALIRTMSRLKITEEQDLISRLIIGSDRLPDDQLETLTRTA